jgi:branched-chain amino acid transport system substrate-binding protein
MVRWGWARRRRLVIAAGVACGLVVASACSSSKSGSGSSSPSSSTASSASSSSGSAGSNLLGPANAATGPAVKLGLISDGKSEAIDNTSEITSAKAAVQYVNAHLGGVAGHVLQLDVCTDGQTPAGATSCDNQMITDKVVAVVYGVSGQGGSIFTGLQAAKIPLLAFQSIDQSTLLSKTAFAITNGLGALAGPPLLLQQAGGTRGAVIVTDVPAASGPVKQIDPTFYKNAGATLDVVSIPPGVADMTPQVQAELAKNPDQVSIIGNDTFCVSAIKALKSLGYTKQIVVIPQCISPTAISELGNDLTGLTEVTPLSTDPSQPEVALYNAVMAAYAPGTPPNGSVTPGGYGAVMSFVRAMTAATGPITPATVYTTVTSMSPQPLPLAPGLTFQCDQTQISFAPAVCSTGYLSTTLNAQGNPVGGYKSLNLTPILKL